MSEIETDYDAKAAGGLPRFDEVMAKLGDLAGIYSQADLSRALGVSRATVSDAKKRGSFPLTWALSLARTLHISVDYLVGLKTPEVREEAVPYNSQPTVMMQADDSFLMVPKVKARLSAGGGSLETNSEVTGLYAFRDEWLRSKGNPTQMVLMEVAGDSMEPELRDGDTVLINQGQKDILAGKLYAVGIGDMVVVKQVETIPGKLVLRSINPNHAPVEVDLGGDLAEEVRIIGRVVWQCRER